MSSEAGIDFDSTPTDAILGKDGVNAPWNSHVGSHAYQDIMDIKRADMVACLGQAALIAHTERLVLQHCCRSSK